ncbi:tol-pal system protein YbgF [Herminiimonas sp. CN]|uniref:tol-pal system protein YbgF n=1 Tax=Herminiimonas sp. CN TaxID=1349818 RepID=UPI0004732D20|nr:tol-pal system protein YbgF [Herminiimonas sp. CN]
MKTSIHSTLAAALMVVFTHVAVPAHAGLFDDDEARRAVLDLRSRIDASNARIDGKADKNSTLDLANQNEQLQAEIAKLRGQVELLSNELTNTQRRQKDFYVDLDNRLRKLEPQKITVDGKEASVQPSEQLAYDTALASFKAGDYKHAGAGFSDFLRRYPQSGYAPSAQYWLGNAYYAQRDYKNAIAAQQLVIQNYPDNPKAADAMLNIASCYTELKDKANARKALEKLIAQYPGSSTAQTAKERLSTFK